MPNRIPTPNVPTPKVRKSPAAVPAPKPKSTSISKGGYTTTYNSKGQPIGIKNNKSGASAGTANTPGFANGSRTE